ncbi:hypothetical protein R1flu_014451 [Riccia fluitans]|uniref:Uncharacterized protein n=1 Tax=Riccia fluitans TaxID=41844 RepID=A0ABD1YGH1_9MARC
MEVVSSAISLQAWHACSGCTRKESAGVPKTLKVFQLQQHHSFVGFRYGRISSNRRSVPSPASASEIIYNTKRSFQPMASTQSSQGSESSNTGSAGDDEDEGEEDEGYEEESQGMFEENLEVAVRAVLNLFRDYSTRAIRAIREILPPAISTQLIAFGVNGFILVSLLWIFRAVLEVFCSLATYIFGGLLTVRLAWSAVVSAQAGRDSTWSPRGN